MSNDWDKTELGLHATFFKGNGLPKSALKDNGKYNCIHYGQLFTHYSEAITKIKSKTDYLGVLGCVNDVLMPTSDVTPNGLAKASCLHVDNVVIGGDILIVRPKAKLDGTFLSFVIKSSEKQVLSLATGSTVFHLYAKDMEKFKFLMPKNKIEQEKIAKSLLSANNTINYLQKFIEKKELILNGVMQELLSGKKRVLGITNKWKKVDFNGKEIQIPDDWELNVVGRISRVSTGNTPSTKQESFWHESQGIKWLSTPDFRINRNGYIASNTRFLTNEGAKKARICPKNTLLVSCIATIGEVGLLEQPSAFNQQINAIWPNDKVSTKYLKYFFIYYKENFINYAPENVVKIINKDLFEKYSVFYPSIEEQEKIANILLAMEKEIDKLKSKLNKLIFLKKGMEEQLLTGKIRLPLN